MKTRIAITYGIVAVCLALFIGCGNNNSSNPLGGCNGAAWGQEVSDELTNASEASSAYANDPTVEKCEIYKDALRDYYNALEGVSAACIPQASEQEYQEALAEAETSIDEIDCTEPDGP